MQRSNPWDKACGSSLGIVVSDQNGVSGPGKLTMPLRKGLVGSSWSLANSGTIAHPSGGSPIRTQTPMHGDMLTDMRRLCLVDNLGEGAMLLPRL